MFIFIGDFGVNLEYFYVFSYEEEGIDYVGEFFFLDNCGNIMLDWNDGDKWIVLWCMLFIGFYGDEYYIYYEFVDNYFKYNVIVFY